MTKPHAAAVTAILGAAAVAGVLALGSTVSLGQASTSSPTVSAVERQAALDRAEAQITQLEASVPPPLPTEPAVPSTAAPRVVVVRAASATETAEDVHWDDDEDEHDDEHEGSDHDDDDDDRDGHGSWDDEDGDD